MFGWAKSLLGIGTATAGSAVQNRAEQRLLAAFDNARTNEENVRNWWQADYLSAKAANNFQVRRTLRIRSRYEVSNNAYLFGVCNSNADDLINTGPTLKCLLSDQTANRQIESRWREWADEVGLVEKLRTCKLARTVDGEGFLILKTVKDLENPVKLYPVDVEADQVTTVAPRDLAELWVDGMILHPVTGRPSLYTVTKYHPGDLWFPNMNPLATEHVPAKFVVHWFPKFRPGQVRGVPIFTPALDLFTELRSYRKAVLSKAQVAANLTAVLESEAPADSDGTHTPTPWEHIPIDRGTMTTVPGGAKLKQFESGEPATTYQMFQEAGLGEACRPLAYPLNLALGTSQRFNFSSAKLDHINYRNSLDVERGDCNAAVLDKIKRAWIEEGVLVPGYFPRWVIQASDIPSEWHWPGYQPLDPVVDATADHDRLSNGTDTYQAFWARRGYDWKDIFAQQAAEKEELEKLLLVFGDPLKKSNTVRVNVDQTSDEQAEVDDAA